MTINGIALAECEIRRRVDPILEFNRDVRERGKPSLPWMVRHTVNGEDQLEAARNASSDSLAMLDLLRLARDGKALADAFAAALSVSDASRSARDRAWREIFGTSGRTVNWSMPPVIGNTLRPLIQSGRAQEWRLCAAIRRVANPLSLDSVLAHAAPTRLACQEQR